MDYKWPDLKLKISCSSWTYIRSIANDLWENLWCWWYLTWLKRTEIENLKLENAIEKDEISEEKILSLDKFLDFPKIFLDEEILERMNFWQRISVENEEIFNDKKNISFSKEIFFSIYDKKENFIWVWKTFDWILKKEIFI